MFVFTVNPTGVKPVVNVTPAGVLRSVYWCKTVPLESTACTVITAVVVGGGAEGVALASFD